MKQILIFTAALLFLNSPAFAFGGMVGGGDVNFKTLMTCDATSIDPAFPSAPYLWVVKEVDYNGQVLSDATLRVVTVDSQLRAVRYYLTHQTELLPSSNGSYALSIWKYDLGSTGNRQTGSLKWDQQNAQGTLQVSESPTERESLQLSNCIIFQ